MTRHLPWRLDDRPDAPFPPAETALRDPDGLLALGGDLSPVRLLNAYAGGIFPWFSQGQPLLWWSPDPRMVFRTDGVHLSSRFRRSLRASSWVLRADTRFREVIEACAASPRPGQDGTWITRDMIEAYVALHALGFAHSIEVLDGDRLVGGIYGVAIDRCTGGKRPPAADGRRTLAAGAVPGGGAGAGAGRSAARGVDGAVWRRFRRIIGLRRTVNAIFASRGRCA